MNGYGSLFEWLIVIGVILALIYTSFIIKNEKNTFLETALPLDFHGYRFLIPSWWDKTLDETDTLTFERTDTRYDWKATFTWMPFEGEGMGIEDKFKSLMKEREILFDPDTGDILNPADFCDHPLSSSSPSTEMVRIEGMATQEQVDRIYYDAFLLKDKEQKAFLLCESRSSILNGLVEGPYFEEAILRLDIKKAT